jgi:methylenetetrahydrofolate reductase (NADPH)
MNGGAIPGCRVTDELVSQIAEESAASDKGKGARIERCAQHMASLKGMKFAGVHLGGFGLKCDDFRHIIERAEEIGDNWRDHVSNLGFDEKDEFYLFPDDPEMSFAEDKLVPVTVPIMKRTSLHHQSGLAFHRMVFTEGKLGHKFVGSVNRMLEKWKFGSRLAHGVEKLIKQLLFDCRECGDCALFDMAYLCPMSQCAKFQRNGPCGGGVDGLCEVDTDGTKRCVWTVVYERSAWSNKIDALREYVPPVNCSLRDTSSWANYFMGRDHTARKLIKPAEQSEA